MNHKELLKTELRKVSRTSHWLGVLLGLIVGPVAGFALGYAPGSPTTVVVPLAGGIGT